MLYNIYHVFLQLDSERTVILYILKLEKRKKNLNLDLILDIISDCSKTNNEY